MKQSVLISVCVLFVFVGKTQIPEMPVSSQRDSVLKLFIAHRDTITKDTWISVMQSNNYLNQLIRLDSLLLIKGDSLNVDSIRSAHAKQMNDYESLVKTIDFERVQLQQENKFYKKMFYMLLFISLLFLLLIVVLLMLTGRLNKAVKVKEQQVKTYHTKLYDANIEVEKSRTTENKLASEINKLKKQLSDGSNTIQEVELLQEEKLMLENQILEVKKAYEMEANRCTELEAALAQKKQVKQEESTDEDSGETHNMIAQNKRLQGELDKLLHKIDELETLNKAHGDELKLQIGAKETAEKRLEELIRKLQNISKDL